MGGEQYFMSSAPAAPAAPAAPGSYRILESVSTTDDDKEFKFIHQFSF